MWADHGKRVDIDVPAAASRTDQARGKSAGSMKHEVREEVSRNAWMGSRWQQLR